MDIRKLRAVAENTAQGTATDNNQVSTNIEKGTALKQGSTRRRRQVVQESPSKSPDAGKSIDDEIED